MKGITKTWTAIYRNENTSQFDVCKVKFNLIGDVYKIIPSIVQQCYEFTRLRFPVKIDKDNPSFSEIWNGDWNENRSYWTEILVERILTEELKLKIDLKPTKQLEEHKEMTFINWRISSKHSYIIENILSNQEKLSQIFSDKSDITEPNTMGTFSSLNNISTFRIIVKITDSNNISTALYTYIHEFVHFLNYLEILYKQGEIEERELKKIIGKSFKKGLRKWFNITRC
jgi:hypothetical protein